MIKAIPRVYWDACTWIAYIRKEMPSEFNTIKHPRHTMCREVLIKAEAKELEVVTSAFSLSEVCKRRSEMQNPSINLPGFFNQPYVLLINVDKTIGERAQNLQLAGVGNLRPQDATHVASALVWSIPVFHTFDGGLLDLDKLLTMNDGNQLRIVRPTEEFPKPGLLEAMQNGE